MSQHTLRSLLESVGSRELADLARRWQLDCDGLDRAGTVVRLSTSMEDEELVHSRLAELPQKLSRLLESFLEQGTGMRTVAELVGEARAGDAFQSRYELEAQLAALHREGFVFPASGKSWNTFDEPCYAVPGELATCVRGMRERRRSEIADTVTLKGFLEARYFERAAADHDPDKAADHARKIYKLYLMEASIRGRIDKLPAGVRQVFDVALTRFGGLMPVEALEHEELDVDVDLVRKCFEETMLGTVAPLRLRHFGIRPQPSAIVVFQEVVLIRLRAASQTQPVAADQVLSAGVDLVTNVGRFLRQVAGSKVQFTVEGKLYKASAKRISRDFLAVPGGLLGTEEQVQLVYRFCLSRRLIERSGERALRTTDSAEDFDRAELMEKLRQLVSFAVEDRELPGEPYHHTRLRRTLLRLLKRVEPEQWHEALYLPFLARNAYLGTLGESRVEEFFAARFKTGGYRPSEDLQRVSLNLLVFVKRRLYPLGIVDLGIEQGRPTSLRLSRLGAELLGAQPAGEVGGTRSSVVVNPDFEVILFPGDDEHEVVHTFDRFAERLKTDHIHHFRLSRDSVVAGLRDGLGPQRIVAELEDRSRSPLPQNVLYSVEEWCDGAGLLTMNGSRVLYSRRAEHLDRALDVAQLRRWVAGRPSPTELLLRDDAPVDRVVAILRDRGLVVERDGNDGDRGEP